MSEISFSLSPPSFLTCFAQIFIQWRGPSASGMIKVKANQVFQEALNVLAPNHGQLEAVGKTEFTEQIISEKWHPSAGSHVIN